MAVDVRSVCLLAVEAGPRMAGRRAEAQRLASALCPNPDALVALVLAGDAPCARTLSVGTREAVLDALVRAPAEVFACGCDAQTALADAIGACAHNLARMGSASLTSVVLAVLGSSSLVVPDREKSLHASSENTTDANTRTTASEGMAAKLSAAIVSLAKDARARGAPLSVRVAVFRDAPEGDTPALPKAAPRAQSALEMALPPDMAWRHTPVPGWTLLERTSQSERARPDFGSEANLSFRVETPRAPPARREAAVRAPLAPPPGAAPIWTGRLVVPSSHTAAAAADVSAAPIANPRAGERVPPPVAVYHAQTWPVHICMASVVPVGAPAVRQCVDIARVVELRAIAAGGLDDLRSRLATRRAAGVVRLGPALVMLVVPRGEQLLGLVVSREAAAAAARPHVPAAETGLDRRRRPAMAWPASEADAAPMPRPASQSAHPASEPADDPLYATLGAGHLTSMDDAAHASSADDFFA